jgi:hypothetical protein
MFPITYKIGGESFSNSAYINMNDKGDAGYTITLASGTTTIQHNTTTGVGSFSVECDGLADAAGYGPGTVKLAKTTVLLPTIDRTAPTITLETSSVTASSVNIAAIANVTSDIWDYSIDNGSTWTRLSTTAGKSASKKITGLSPNTTYKIKVRARRQSNQVYGASSAKSVTTLGNTLLNSVNNLTVGTASAVLVMNWTVYDDYAHTLVIKDGSTTVLTLTDLTGSVGTNNKTVLLTPDQKTTILRYMSDKQSFEATFYLTTHNAGTQIGSTVSAMATIQTTAETSAPIFSGFRHYAAYQETEDVTGSNQIYLKKYSTMMIVLGSASPQNEASISSYRVTVGSKVKTFDTTSTTLEFGNIEVYGNVVVKVEVIDSRGYSTAVTETITVINYDDVSITDYSIRRKNEVESTVQLAFSGKIAPAVVDGIARNSVDSAMFRYMPTGGSWSGWNNLAITQTSRNFEYSTAELSNSSGVIEFDPNLQYTIAIRVADRLTIDTMTIVLNKGTPLVALRSKKVGINTADPQAALDIWGDGELLKLNGLTIQQLMLETIYPVGSIYVGVNATNPSVLFGGEWEQIKDRFLLAAGDNYNAGSTGGEAEHTLTVAEMPSHYHEIPWDKAGSQGYRGVNTYTDNAGFNGNSQYYTEHKGGNQPHNNMPPYIAVYMWKRVE